MKIFFFAFTLIQIQILEYDIFEIFYMARVLKFYVNWWKLREFKKLIGASVFFFAQNRAQTFIDHTTAC